MELYEINRNHHPVAGGTRESYPSVQDLQSMKMLSCGCCKSGTQGWYSRVPPATWLLFF